MSDEAATKPMLETILAEIREGFASIGERLTLIETRLTSIETRVTSIEKRVDIVEAQLVQMDARNDKQEGLFHLIRGEVLGLRADFKEFRAQFKAPA